MSGVLVGLDVGGSKTAIRAVDGQGDVRYEATLPTDRWRGESWAGKAAILVAAVRSVVPVPVPVLALAVGAHGCDTDEQCAALARELDRLLDVPVRVVNDAQLLGHAVSRPEAVGLIAGTGAIAVATTTDGRTVHAGGWGWLVGDDGGATGIMRETVRAALQASDRGASDLVLERSLSGAAEVGTLGDLAFGMMLARPERWATHASAVFVAADAGSSIARTVLDAAAASLAGLVTVVERLGAPVGHVVLGGGVVRGQPRYAARVAELIRAEHPGTTVVLLHEPPVAGAVALARQLVPSPPHPERMHHPIP